MVKPRPLSTYLNSQILCHDNHFQLEGKTRPLNTNDKVSRLDEFAEAILNGHNARDLNLG
jgi:hypothetical protein